MAAGGGSPSVPDQKRARFIELAEEAAAAAEEAAKRVKIAQEFASQLLQEHPDYPAAQDTAEYMEQLTSSAAKTWVLALEGKTVFQNWAEVITIRTKHMDQKSQNKRLVMAYMGLRHLEA